MGGVSNTAVVSFSSHTPQNDTGNHVCKIGRSRVALRLGGPRHPWGRFQDGSHKQGDYGCSYHQDMVIALLVDKAAGIFQGSS